MYDYNKVGEASLPFYLFEIGFALMKSTPFFVIINVSRSIIFVDRRSILAMDIFQH